MATLPPPSSGSESQDILVSRQTTTGPVRDSSPGLDQPLEDTLGGEGETITNGDGVSAWVPYDVVIVEEAPTDGNPYYRQDGDWITGTAPVDSVNGQQGVVVLDPDDLDDAATDHKFTSQSEIDKLGGVEAGAQVNTVNKADVYTLVFHGSDPNTSRPPGWGGVIWTGSVQPVNATGLDLVIRTDEAV